MPYCLWDWHRTTDYDGMRLTGRMQFPELFRNVRWRDRTALAGTARCSLDDTIDDDLADMDVPWRKRVCQAARGVVLRRPSNGRHCVAGGARRSQSLARHRDCAGR